MFGQGKETEHNWAIREQAINNVRGMIKGGDVLERYYDTFMAHLKQFLERSLKTVSSYFTGPLPMTNLPAAAQFTHDSGSEHMFTVLRTRGRARNCI